MGRYLVSQAGEDDAPSGVSALGNERSGAFTGGAPDVTRVLILDGDGDSPRALEVALLIDGDVVWPVGAAEVVLSGDLERDDGGGTLLVYQVWPAAWVTKAKAVAAHGVLEVTGRAWTRQLSAPELELDTSTDKGILASLASAMNRRGADKLRCLIWSDGWAIPGLADWRQERARHHEDEATSKARNAAAAARRRWSEETAFINPYNFVPLPKSAGPERSAPTSHEALGPELLSGRITFSLTALTPLAISGTGTGKERTQPIEPYRLDGSLAIAGSTLAGVVRTFHEALTGSCMRVVDVDYVPVHREPAVSHLNEGWRMAIVEEDDTSVRLCEPVVLEGETYAAVWVEAAWLGAAVGSLRSGQPFEFNPGPHDVEIPRNRERPELTAAGSTNAPRRLAHDDLQPGDWTTMVTKRLARQVTLEGFSSDGHHFHPYHLPFAKVTAEVVAIGADALDDYRQVAEGSEDPTSERKNQMPTLAVREDAARRAATIGQRQPKVGDLPRGTVVWVDTRGSGDHLEITRISRASIWRRRGEFPVRDRIDRFGPCTDPNALCPSCRMFGMVHEREQKRTRTGIHEAFRGRVRFGWVEFDGTPEDRLTSAQQIGPLGQPRPSSGQFYLEGSPASGGKRAHLQSDRPLRDWGAAADQPKPRRVRGRKRYWTVAADRARDVGVHNDNAELRIYQRLVKATSVAHGWITFEGVTSAEFGSLLAALDPNLLGDIEQTWQPDAPSVMADRSGHPYVHQIGKAKSKGLGAVKVDVTEIRTWTASRYGAEPHDLNGSAGPDVPDVKAVVKEFVASVPDVVKATWPALLAMAQYDRFPADVVTFPPDDRPGTKFKFDFWQKSSGRYLSPRSTVREGLVLLPDAAAPDPRIQRPWLEDNR